MIIKILSTNTSTKKGTIKTPCSFIELTANGVEGDAHSGKWHRQVSLLAMESIEKFEAEAKRKIKPGEFAENITTQGIELHQLKPFDRLNNSQVELMVTQIGKKCHGDNCNIFKEIGNCVMPKEGIFARVERNGRLKAGDELKLIPKYFNIKIITLSDRASKGEYKDKSGPLLETLTQEYFSSIGYPIRIEKVIITDDSLLLENELNQCFQSETDLIFTTGGTGFGTRDITPDVVKKLIDKEIPGIMEMVRLKYGVDKPNALLSRSIAGIKNQTLIFSLPGNPKAVNEYFGEIKRILLHLYLMMADIDAH